MANFSHIGKARGCSTNSLMINSVSHWEWAFSSHIFKVPPRPNGESTSSYNIDKVTMILTFLYRKGIKIPSVVQKLRPFYQKGWIWPIGVVASGRVCAAGLFIKAWNVFKNFWRTIFHVRAILSKVDVPVLIWYKFDGKIHVDN